MASNHSSRPRVACEVSAERVVAARADAGAASLEAVSIAKPAGRDGYARTAASQYCFAGCAGDGNARVAGAGGGRSRDITLVIPDASTRILLLDFDTLPEKPQDADAVVRFRLKKSLPFDVDTSSVSFDHQPAEKACGWWRR